MIIKSIHEYGIKHVPYGNEDLTHVELVMDADNDSHYRAMINGRHPISEEDYWYALIKQERDEQLRKDIQAAMLLARGGNPTEVK